MAVLFASALVKAFARAMKAGLLDSSAVALHEMGVCSTLDTRSGKIVNLSRQAGFADFPGNPQLDRDVA